LKDFNIGDVAYRMIRPTETVTGECALPVTIESVVKEESNQGTVIIKYYVTYGTFDEGDYLEPKYLFASKQEALDGMKKILCEDLIKLNDKILKINNALEEIR